MLPIPTINLPYPHDCLKMSVPRLTGQIGNRGYWMLVDSGSQSNVMTLQQAQDLALSIDISGNPWVLKGISGHLITLEGICWNVLIKIGGMLFPHNFFISHTVLGGKDIILGQSPKGESIIFIMWE